MVPGHYDPEFMDLYHFLAVEATLQPLLIICFRHTSILPTYQLITLHDKELRRSKDIDIVCLALIAPYTTKAKSEAGPHYHRIRPWLLKENEELQNIVKDLRAKAAEDARLTKAMRDFPDTNLQASIAGPTHDSMEELAPEDLATVSVSLEYVPSEA